MIPNTPRLYARKNLIDLEMCSRCFKGATAAKPPATPAPAPPAPGNEITQARTMIQDRERRKAGRASTMLTQTATDRKTILGSSIS